VHPDRDNCHDYSLDADIEVATIDEILLGLQRLECHIPDVYRAFLDSILDSLHSMLEFLDSILDVLDSMLDSLDSMLGFLDSILDSLDSILDFLDSILHT